MIEERGFSPYFLIVNDIGRQARHWGMRTVGRGSAACSIVSYCLGITHVDPLALHLHFERFLNPERSSPPDIDLDFSWKDRDRILKYVYEKYGEDRVAMISTHVTFAARSAVREIGKAYGLSGSELRQFTRHIPPYGTRSLTDLSEEAPECRDLPVDEEPYRTILALGERVAGFPRHLSVHAGGIVISPRPITDLLPLERAAKGLVVTQYNMGPVEELGLIKIDLLSQRSLGVIGDAAAAVEEHTGAAPPIDDYRTILHDRPTRRLIREGRTMGCFYIESPAMRSLLRKLRTETFEELTAASSVIRPGVAESGMMQEYIGRHRRALAAPPLSPPPEEGEGTSWYLHPLLRNVLSETHGVHVSPEHLDSLAGTEEPAEVTRKRVRGRKYKNKSVKLPVSFDSEWSAEFSRERVKQRVESGGHDIPDEAIARRYKRTVSNFLNVFITLCDEVMCYDNSLTEPWPVFAEKEGERTVLDEDRYQLILESCHE